MIHIRSSLGFRRRAVVGQITMGCDWVNGEMMFSKFTRIAGKQLMLAVFLCVSAFGQAPVGSRAAQRLEEYRQSKAATLRDDFGELARYRAANASLKAAVPDEKRGGFFGDS